MIITSQRSTNEKLFLLFAALQQAAAATLTRTKFALRIEFDSMKLLQKLRAPNLVQVYISIKP